MVKKADTTRGIYMKASQLTRETIGDLGISKRDLPTFEVGDTIAISLRIKEYSEKLKKHIERLQVFEGDVIAMHHKGASSTFTIRKIGANSIPVERIFPLYSPKIASIKFIRSGKVRRAKLFYMRDRKGKAARVQELVLTKQQKEQRAKAREAKSTEAKTQTEVKKA